jgi:hypothetical protein
VKDMINGLSIVRILGGISKSLDIIQKISPLYNDIKPLFKKINIYLTTNNNVETRDNNDSKNSISFFQ